MSDAKDKIVISLGGSLVVPDGGPNTKFLSEFNRFIRKKLAENKNRQFFIVVGGGKVARNYRDAGKEVVGKELTPDDLDWLGIHATRLNAHLLRTIFRDIAHPNIIKDYGVIRKAAEPVVIGAGWKPGWSTDYDAVLLCKDYGADTVINLSNIQQVYDKDPKKFSDAKPINKISWKEFKKLVGSKWGPGLNAPFDPIASAKASKLGIKAVILRGDNLKNLDNYFKNKKFVGTIIN
ncbi:MAG: UMP kinase [Candidatus Harrisonbacteria bacterium]|nr:UMP kinase [Candidatus Harrisonbacteria bacterium]